MNNNDYDDGNSLNSSYNSNNDYNHDFSFMNNKSNVDYSNEVSKLQETNLLIKKTKQYMLSLANNVNEVKNVTNSSQLSDVKAKPIIKNSLNRQQSTRLTECLKLIKEYELEIKHKNNIIEKQSNDIQKLQAKVNTLEANKLSELKTENYNLFKKLQEKQKEITLKTSLYEEKLTEMKDHIDKLTTSNNELLSKNNDYNDKQHTISCHSCEKSKMSKFEIEEKNKKISTLISKVKELFLDSNQSNKANYDSSLLILAESQSFDKIKTLLDSIILYKNN